MKITAKMLSNETLIALVDAVIEARLLPDDLIRESYKHSLASQLSSIKRQLENIGKKAENKKIARKEFAVLSRKQQQLVSLGNKKLDILKRLDYATDHS